MNPQARQTVIEVLWEARESLIAHAVRLPLSRRDHGPVLVRIDQALGLLAEEPVDDVSAGLSRRAGNTT